MNKDSPFSLEARNLSKSFKKDEKPLFSDVSFTGVPGDTIAIIGPSGIGKSTLLNILGTLEKPTSGKVLINGFDAFTRPNRTRNSKIGFVFQSYHLLEEKSVWENVTLPLLISRKSINQSTAYLESIFERLGISYLKNRLCKYLSGGEKQRVAIARALANNPEIILADEPTGNLDEKLSSSIQSLLIEITKSLNKTLLVVTHDLEFSSLCDHTYSLKDRTLS